MAQISTISSTQPQITALDALWTLFQAQSQSVRMAFVQRLLNEPTLSKKKESAKTADSAIRQLDSLLYGSIQLPIDFDYDKELQNTLKAKYTF